MEAYQRRRIRARVARTEFARLERRRGKGFFRWGLENEDRVFVKRKLHGHADLMGAHDFAEGSVNLVGSGIGKKADEFAEAILGFGEFEACAGSKWRIQIFLFILAIEVVAELFFVERDVRELDPIRRRLGIGTRRLGEILHCVFESEEIGKGVPVRAGTFAGEERCEAIRTLVITASVRRDCSLYRFRGRGLIFVEFGDPFCRGHSENLRARKPEAVGSRSAARCCAGMAGLSERSGRYGQQKKRG